MVIAHNHTPKGVYPVQTAFPWLPIRNKLDLESRQYAAVVVSVDGEAALTLARVEIVQVSTLAVRSFQDLIVVQVLGAVRSPIHPHEWMPQSRRRGQSPRSIKSQ